VFAVLAFVLWAAALWTSWGGSCPLPSPQSGGLDKGVSVWPPAAQCIDKQGDPFWHQALPWAPWVIGALILSAAAVLLAGLIVAIRDLTRPTAAAEEPARMRATTSLDGPAGGYPTRRRDDGGERDQEVLAA
jgi:hypothetical protein